MVTAAIQDIVPIPFTMVSVITADTMDCTMADITVHTMGDTVPDTLEFIIGMVWDIQDQEVDTRHSATVTTVTIPLEMVTLVSDILVDIPAFIRIPELVAWQDRRHTLDMEQMVGMCIEEEHHQRCQIEYVIHFMSMLVTENN